MEKFPGFTTSGILNDIQNKMEESKCEPERKDHLHVYVQLPTEEK